MNKPNNVHNEKAKALKEQIQQMSEQLRTANYLVDWLEKRIKEKGLSDDLKKK